LVDALRAAGCLDDPEWVAAFTDVPRGLFVPGFWQRTPTGQRQWVDGGDPAQYNDWLDAVYSDDSLVTELHGDGTPASSSTQPSLTARMLHALDVHDGHRVLEIGTGTGYNAALLCHRLGAQNVTSIDIDARCVAAASINLAILGYAARLLTANGLEGLSEHAPYDRIIATCATTRVPAAWIHQCRPGGVVLANIGLGVMPLRVADDGGSATGAALRTTASFVPARAGNAPPNLSATAALALREGESRTEPATVTTDLHDEDFLAWLQIAVPGLTRVAIKHEGGPFNYLFAAHDRSWALGIREPGQPGQVRQGGPRDLWPAIAEARDRWVAAGHPPHWRLGLTVDTSGAHRLWVDQPGHHEWELPDTN
jgi:methyltransferase of ATP-grasp peptide maturase system